MDPSRIPRSALLPRTLAKSNKSKRRRRLQVEEVKITPGPVPGVIILGQALKPLTVRPLQLAASFIFNLIRNVCSWHICAFAAPQHLRRYWGRVNIGKVAPNGA